MCSPGGQPGCDVGQRVRSAPWVPVLLVVPALGFTGAHHPIHGHMVASVRLLGMFAQVVFPVERLCQQ